MHPTFSEQFSNPEVDIHKVVFYPDRIYHAQYLNATRSPRYRYNVQEVRGKHDILVLKGEVYLDGLYLTNFLRLEYRASRLVETARERGRFVRGEMLAWMRLHPAAGQPAEGIVKLRYDRWTDTYQVEVWGTLETRPGTSHAYAVLDLMGPRGSITRSAALSEAIADIKGVRRVELAFRENDRDLPYGYRIGDDQAAWDNNYLSSHEEPRNATANSADNTVIDRNYLIDFQRGWFISHARDIDPVRYENAMMDAGNPDMRAGNIIEMRWLLQREFGGTVVFFHEVTIPPGTVEGTHRHLGSEELYYITEGSGVAYMGENDDPGTEEFPVVDRHVFGFGTLRCREVPVEPGSVIYTKSGGIHGIANPGASPLRFVAFLYHSA